MIASPTSTTWLWWAQLHGGHLLTRKAVRHRLHVGAAGAGGASMVSQSGNLGLQLLVSADRRKGGVGKFIGVGNEAMIDAVDFINYLHDDPRPTP